MAVVPRSLARCTGQVIGLAGAIIVAGMPAAQAEPPAASQAAVHPYRKPILVDDFESASDFADAWKASPGMSARVVPLDDQPELDGVSGHVLLLTAEPRSFIEHSPMRRIFVEGDTLIFRMNAISAGEETPVAVDVRFIAHNRAAWRSRLVRVTEPGWREYRLPLRTIAPVGGGYTLWEAVDRVGFSFRRAAAVAIDGVKLTRGADHNAAYFRPAQLGKLAFGEQMRAQTRAPFIVITDAPRLDADALLDKLTRLVEVVKTDLPDLKTPTRLVPILIFSDEADYRAFWPRLGEYYGIPLKTPASEGYTAVGVAGSFCADDACGLRAVWVHEAAHALLAPMLGLAANGSWLQEGLATRYQLRLMPQRDLAEKVRTAAADPATRLPLAKLVDGRRIDPAYYWQAASLVGFFLDQSDWRPRFIAALNGLSARGMSDLRLVLQSRLKVKLRGLERRWLEWVQHGASPATSAPAPAAHGKAPHGGPG